MANKYKVKVSYISFMFEDRNEAIDFAETAFDKMVDEIAKGKPMEKILRKEK